eukprot:gnl/TRDRNA2_/TRDRNA2_171549_c0_seq2.p2 gnl/TRDRNA2_/TRDRNA2_171549_c0~~gnl/TRDRNA2_/TRDRNA2_171549_c0_seq2.p2  ORF type:complete len:116 (+),score=15.86 gnl/TRDRNA2_/TRDRNA2_171549_c0_seq2:115-462(+)
MQYIARRIIAPQMGRTQTAILSAGDSSGIGACAGFGGACAGFGGACAGLGGACVGFGGECTGFGATLAGFIIGAAVVDAIGANAGAGLDIVVDEACIVMNGDPVVASGIGVGVGC